MKSSTKFYMQSIFFSTTMVDINKILNLKPKIKFKTTIPEQYWDYLDVSDENETNQLPPIRGKKKINHEIELLEKKKGKTNGLLGPVIQHVKRRIFGIEENIDRIFRSKFHSNQYFTNCSPNFFWSKNPVKVYVFVLITKISTA